MIARIADHADRLFSKMEDLTLFRIITVVLAAIIGAESSIRMIRRPFAHGDFGVYLHAARAMLAGANIYATPTHPVANGGLFYIYPPLLAFLFIPLTWLPENAAIVLWTVLNILLVAWVVPAAFEIVSGEPFSATPVRTRWAIAFFSLLLTGRFILQHLDRGQTNILEMALLVLGIQLAARGARGPALGGVIIGLSVALKVITAPYALWLGMERQVKTLASAGMGLAVGLGAPALLLGWKANSFLLSFWFRNYVLNSAQRETTLGLGFNYSIRAVLLRLFTPVVAFEYGGHAYRFTLVQVPVDWIYLADWAIRFAILGVVIGYWFRSRKSSELVARGGGMAITCAAIPLLFPTAQQNYFVFLLPTVIFIVYWQKCLKAKNSFFQVWIAAYVLLAVLTVQGLCGKFLSQAFVAIGSVPLGTICLICAVFSVARADAATLSTRS